MRRPGLQTRFTLTILIPNRPTTLLNQELLTAV